MENNTTEMFEKEKHEQNEFSVDTASIYEVSYISIYRVSRKTLDKPCN